MNFTIYEIISHIIPGYILIFILRGQLGIEIKDLGNIGIIALAYALGFIIQTLASWAEDILNFTWGGNPSIQLLNGKQIWKVKFYSWKEAKEILKNEAKANGELMPSDNYLFELAKIKVNSQKYERVISFNAVYALSRAMTISFFISLLATIYFNRTNFQLIIIIAIFTIIAWYRSKQRAYYYVKEILSMYIASYNK